MRSSSLQMQTQHIYVTFRLAVLRGPLSTPLTRCEIMFEKPTNQFPALETHKSFPVPTLKFYPNIWIHCEFFFPIFIHSVLMQIMHINRNALKGQKAEWPTLIQPAKYGRVGYKQWIDQKLEQRVGKIAQTHFLHLWPLTIAIPSRFISGLFCKSSSFLFSIRWNSFIVSLLGFFYALLFLKAFKVRYFNENFFLPLRERCRL